MVHHVDDDFGTPGSKEYALVKGKEYIYRIKWLATNIESPDYDWRAFINDLSVAGIYDGLYGTGGFIVEDGDNLLTSVTHGDETDLTIDKEGKIIVPKVDFIEASSAVADNSPQQFDGETEHPFVPTNGVLNGGPGQHLVIFYKDVIDSSFNIQNFDIDLRAEILPAAVTSEMLNELWHKATPPWSGTFNKTDSFSVKYQNPKEGGNYKIDFHNYFGLGSNVDIKSEANITLPLAGAEVDSVVQADIIRADAFATTVTSKYNLRQRMLMSNLKNWFVYNAGGDYTGRPDNSNNQTVRLYNQVIGNEDPDNERWGWGAVCTWKGQPIRIGKISNFVTAYGLRKIVDIRLVGWAGSKYKGEVGTQNDQAASESWDAGWDVAGGANYNATVSVLVTNIFYKADEKNQKLWPNSASADNYVVFENFNDPDNQFTSPGFLYMTNP